MQCWIIGILFSTVHYFVCVDKLTALPQILPLPFIVYGDTKICDYMVMTSFGRNMHFLEIPQNAGYSNRVSGPTPIPCSIESIRNTESGVKRIVYIVMKIKLFEMNMVPLVVKLYKKGLLIKGNVECGFASHHKFIKLIWCWIFQTENFSIIV